MLYFASTFNIDSRYRSGRERTDGYVTLTRGHQQFRRCPYCWRSAFLGSFTPLVVYYLELHVVTALNTAGGRPTELLIGPGDRALLPEGAVDAGHKDIDFMSNITRYCS